MPPILGTAPFHVTEMVEAQRTFHLSFGQAFAQWALVEERLSYWFQLVTHMEYEMARHIFFTPRTFSARTDILEAALNYVNLSPPIAHQFIQKATDKAGQLSSFRNRLAHGEQSFDVRAGSPTFKQIILISGKVHPHQAADNAVTVQQLDFATTNFRLLAKLLMDAIEHFQGHPDPVPLEECVRQLSGIPNRAEVPGRDQIPATPQPPPQS